jgi:hypothetical protein
LVPNAEWRGVAEQRTGDSSNYFRSWPARFFTARLGIRFEWMTSFGRFSRIEFSGSSPFSMRAYSIQENNGGGRMKEQRIRKAMDRTSADRRFRFSQISMAQIITATI